jgi:hypothetical protein
MTDDEISALPLRRVKDVSLNDSPLGKTAPSNHGTRLSCFEAYKDGLTGDLYKVNRIMEVTANTTGGPVSAHETLHSIHCSITSIMASVGQIAKQVGTHATAEVDAALKDIASNLAQEAQGMEEQDREQLLEKGLVTQEAVDQREKYEKVAEKERQEEDKKRRGRRRMTIQDFKEKDDRN